MCAFGALIKEPLLSAHELLNVHPSLLPRWRGAAPVERAIMAGDAQHRRLDHAPHRRARQRAGVPRRSEPIGPRDTYGSLAARLQELGGELLRARARRSAGPLEFVEQDEAGVTYAEKIGAEDRLLDPARPAVELERVVRALHPHIGARLQLPDGDDCSACTRRALVGEASTGATSGWA